MSESRLVRVNSIRSQNLTCLGGCIFSGPTIDEEGNVLDAGSYLVVKAAGSLLGGVQVQPGQWWRVSGCATTREVAVNGYRLTERQVDAEDISLTLPSGEHIVTLMAESEDFRGVGRVKARKLWEAFGERLYDIFDEGDAASLTEVLGEEVARQAVAAWRLHGDARTLQWLAAQGFSSALGRKVTAFFGMDTPERIEEDPYRLLSFCAGWKETDRLAQRHFSVAQDDPRRLKGAIEEALYRLFDDGHTAASLPMLMTRLESVLGVQSGTCLWRALVPDALSEGFGNGSYLIGTEHDVHPVGPYVMELSVAQVLAERLMKDLPPLLAAGRVEAILAEHEGAEGFVLNEQQRLAVQAAVAYPLLLITGGAGVGKTTVLKALYEAYDDVDVQVFQVALAGRAAKRLQEATGRPAATIASFLRNTSVENLAAPAVLVIDEASMVDIITMHRLCELLPAHVRLVMAGDPAQLMPVGPGLVFHALVDQLAVPRVELQVVKRHGGAIADAALSIRAGIWPALPAVDTAPIAFFPCGSGNDASSGAAEMALRLYAEAPGQTQILSARRSGHNGVDGLNLRCQQSCAGDAEHLLVWSNEHGQAADTGFRLGDPVLCTRNLWDCGLQNGSLGRLVEIEKEPSVLRNDEGGETRRTIAWVEWDDGERRPVFESMLDDLALGYAITVHKSQGSQWPRVIVVLTGSRLLDRTLIYTAVTRAQVQVLLMGDECAVRQAVEALPKAHHRRVGLNGLLRQALSGMQA